MHQSTFSMPSVAYLHEVMESRKRKKKGAYDGDDLST